MKKAAIITLTGNFNYGNKFQNYALQEIIKRNGYEVYTLWNKTYPYNFLRPLRTVFKNIIMPIKDKKNAIRRWNFYKFSKEYIKTYHKIIYTGMNLKFLNKKFDKFIIGSDQIWNPNFGGDYFGNFHFAKFADKKKCIAYSASIGINEIPNNMKNTYKEGLEHLSAISVREGRAVEIVQEITGLEAKLVLDPTMLLEKEEWEKILKKPKEEEQEKFILTYFLGGLSENEQEVLERYANKNHLKLIEIFSSKKEKNKYFNYNPSEFIYLIKNASMVLTDSFHASVFSIIFEKNFYVFDRNDIGGEMSSRLDTLLGKYSLANRKLDNKLTLFNIQNDNIENYKDIKKIIEADKKESLKFIQNALAK